MSTNGKINNKSSLRNDKSYKGSVMWFNLMFIKISHNKTLQFISDLLSGKHKIKINFFLFKPHKNQNKNQAQI